MSDVLHRTTKAFRRSVNDPDFPAADWIHEPMIGGQRFRDAGVPTKYVEVSGDTVTEMDQAAKDAVDAAEASAAKSSEISAAKAAYRDAEEKLIVALALVVLDEINALRTHPLLSLSARTPAQLRAAIDAKLDAL